MAMWWILSAALIAIVVWAVLKTQSGQGSGSESPEEILKRRYAKGEIDRETYQRMLTDLKG
jgi:putative membrane protein